jgi:hypothetical protein
MVNVAGVKPGAVAVTVTEPGVVGAVKYVCAYPSELVTAVAALSTPDPEGTLNVTVTPVTGWPLALSARTTNGSDVAPDASVCTPP